MALLNPDLADQVRQATRWSSGGHEFNASACMNCGVCSAVCPMGIELLPRKLFRYVLLGMEDQVKENTETIYSCLLCKMCEVNCPAGVHIAENVRSLRHFINRQVFRL
ncbi:MAG: 4Fe-4S dicluster domain-containing protein [Bacillota bacterium]